jgi:NTP pyrophosphatase (non-canonical NTP hydrolase)
MDLYSYQLRAFDYAEYPGRYYNPEYAALGLNGEAGEIANKIKKMQRDGLTYDEVKGPIADELGDVLWYVAAVAQEFSLDLNEVAENNLAKLEDRRKRGVIRGSGDNR